MENRIHFCRGAGIAMDRLIAASAAAAIAIAQQLLGTKNRRQHAYARRVPGKQLVATLLVWMSLVSPSSWSQDDTSARKCKPKSEDSVQPQISKSVLGVDSPNALSDNADAGTRTDAALVGTTRLLDRSEKHQDGVGTVETRLLSLLGEYEDETRFIREEELRESTPVGAKNGADSRVVAVQTSLAGTYVLSLDEPLAEQEVNTLLKPFGAFVVRQIARRPIFVVRVPDDVIGAERAAAIPKIRRLPHVVAVDPEFEFELTSPKTDPLIAHQWHLYNDGSAGGKKGADIGALKGWALSPCDSKRPVVAVIDTGIAINERDLNPNIWTNEKEVKGTLGSDDDGNGYIDDIHGWDFVDCDNDVYTGAGTHGSAVAAIIAAVGGNGVDGSGICPHGQMMPLRASVRGGKFDPDLRLSWVVEAIYYAIDKRATIINAAWGGRCWNKKDCPPEALRAAVAKAAQEQILVVTGAGNSPRTNIDDAHKAFYPASLQESNIISVAATDRKDKLWEGSSWGHKSVDLAAPGHDICAPLSAGQCITQHGTSYATAMVSGAALLIIDRFGIDNFGTDRIGRLRSQILDHVHELPPLKDKTATGGRLDVYKSLCVRPSWMPAGTCSSPCPDISAATH